MPTQYVMLEVEIEDGMSHPSRWDWENLVGQATFVWAGEINANR